MARDELALVAAASSVSAVSEPNVKAIRVVVIAPAHLGNRHVEPMPWRRCGVSQTAPEAAGPIDYRDMMDSRELGELVRGERSGGTATNSDDSKTLLNSHSACRVRAAFSRPGLSRIHGSDKRLRRGSFNAGATSIDDVSLA
jgi:hypothetical protein